MKAIVALCACLVAFAWHPALAVAANRNWVQSGSEGAMVECIDQNSIVKRADGYTQYEELMLCDKSDTSDKSVYVQAVRCDEDMSGGTFAMRTRPLVPFHPSKDGTIHWADIPAEDSTAMVGQSAKFVCRK